jgi:hypothetical protein
MVQVPRPCDRPPVGNSREVAAGARSDRPTLRINILRCGLSLDRCCCSRSHLFAAGVIAGVIDGEGGADMSEIAVIDSVSMTQLRLLSVVGLLATAVITTPTQPDSRRRRCCPARRFATRVIAAAEPPTNPRTRRSYPSAEAPDAVLRPRRHLTHPKTVWSAGLNWAGPLPSSRSWHGQRGLPGATSCSAGTCFSPSVRWRWS